MLTTTALAFACIGISLCLKLTLVKAENTANCPDFRLNPDVVPIHYDLQFKTDFDFFDADNESSFSFHGYATITIKATERDIAIFEVHSHKSINITSIQINFKNFIDPANYSYDDTTNKLSIKLDEPLPVDEKINLTFAYTGHHGNDLKGYYRSSYINEDGELRNLGDVSEEQGERFHQHIKRVGKTIPGTVEYHNHGYLLATQFESTDARRAFPCFDEPEFKASFVVHVYLKKTSVINGYSVLSTMPCDSRIDDGEYWKFNFEQSEVMPTYLLAIVVSDFKATTPVSMSNITFTTYGRDNFIREGKGNIAQAVGPIILKILREITNVGYPLPKMDQVGLPDFIDGAMENWGLVTYREDLIFFSDLRNSIHEKQSIVSIIAHEFAHQWFGNLVTLQWWSYIWLNEGFATLLEYYVTDKIRSEELDTSSWSMMDQLVTDELQATAFEADAEDDSQAMTHEIDHLYVDSIFDDIAYSKGGSILRMWMHMLEEKHFYEGLTTYLTYRKLNASDPKEGTPDALLNSFESSLSENHQLKSLVHKYFEKWHRDPGYPVVTVTRHKNGIMVTQEQFLWNKKSKRCSPWIVPLNMATNNNPDFNSTSPSHFLKDCSANIEIGEFKWIIVNVQQTGYYRVNYDTDNWRQLMLLLKSKPDLIHPINRAQIINDVFSLARSMSNYTTYNIAFDMVQFLHEENELIPWKAALSSLRHLHDKLLNTDLFPRFQMLARNLVKNQFKNLTLSVKEGDSHQRRLLRSLIASAACQLVEDECVLVAKAMFADGIEKIHPDVKETVLCSSIRDGDRSVWDTVWKHFGRRNEAIYLKALGCSKDKGTLMGFLAKSVSDSKEIRRQDAADVFPAVVNGNPENIAVALEFLQNHFEDVVTRYLGSDPLEEILYSIAEKLKTENDVKMLEELASRMSESSTPQVKNAVSNVLSTITTAISNRKWLSSKRQSIESWFEENLPSSASALSVTAISCIISAMLVL